MGIIKYIISIHYGCACIVSISRHKDMYLKPFEKRKVYLAKSIAVYIGVVACLVCLFSEQPAGEHILVADKWTIVLVCFLIGELLTDYFVSKKCHPKEWPHFRDGDNEENE